MTPLETDWLGGAPVSPMPSKPCGRPAKGHRGRQRKLLCGACGFIAYATAGAIERASGLPSCACGERLHLPNLRDRAACEWETLERELQELGGGAYDLAMRELGALDMVARRPVGPQRAGLRRTCEASGCHKFVSGRYCPEHEHERPAMASAYKGRS